jgi:SAM-dependent methyltransferase
MSQSWNPEQYARTARFVADLALPVVELLAPRPGERILDLGCGDGALTEKLAACGCDVVGVDASPEQVAAAKARGLDARVMGATDLAFGREFDAVFSNAVLHWVKDANAAIRGVRRALRPGGRFVGEFGGAENITAIVAALTAELAVRGIDAGPLNPWYYPSPEEYRTRLEAEKFSVSSIQLIPRPTPLPGPMSDWLETFAQSFLNALPADQREPCIRGVEERLRPALCDAQGKWTADYVRLRFAATLPQW